MAGEGKARNWSVPLAETAVASDNAVDDDHPCGDDAAQIWPRTVVKQCYRRRTALARWGVLLVQLGREPGLQRQRAQLCQYHAK